MSLEQAPQAESDEQFLIGLDDRIARCTIPLMRGHVARIATGDPDEYEKALAAHRDAMACDDTTLARLDRLKKDPDPRTAHFATMIRDHVYSSEKRDLQSAIDQTLRDWRAMRASLSSPDGSILGASSLLVAFLSEQDPDRKSMLFTALHDKDEELASMMIALRDARNAYARHKGYANYFSYQLARMGLGEEDVLCEAEAWFRQMRSLPRTTDERIKELHIENSYDSQEVARRVAERLGLGDAYERISFHAFGNGGEMARCIPIDPPGDVAVIVPLGGVHLWEKDEFFEEVGHALHFASTRDDLPYVFRLGSFFRYAPWLEAMDALFTRLAMMHITETVPNGSGKLLEYAAYGESIGSLTASLSRFFFDAYFYSTDEQNPDAIKKEWARIRRWLYNVDIPLYIGGDVPEGYKGPLCEWANDFWIAEHPVYLSHLFGSMIAPQLRAYWLKNGGILLSREFGEWIRRTCWEPGYSKPWRELLKDATEEDFNPQYFFDELEEMKKRTIAA